MKDITHAHFTKIQGCHTLMELRETQGIFKLKEISGNFDLFFKLRELLIFSKMFREVLRFEKSQENFLLDLE